MRRVGPFVVALVSYRRLHYRYFSAAKLGNRIFRMHVLRVGRLLVLHIKRVQ